MANMYLVNDDSGQELDARFSVEGRDIVFASRGGAKGKAAVNADYSRGLLLTVTRLSAASVPILGAWVDSSTVQHLPLSDRTILTKVEANRSPEQICSLLASRMKEVRGDANSNAKGGNSTKRIRIATGYSGTETDLASLLAGQTMQGDFRSRERLPAEVLSRATPEFVWTAVQQFMQGEVEHSFGASTDFDLIADDGRRLPPKAVFGVALSAALGGMKVLPKHFSGGETSTCFRLLRSAGYEIVPKDAAPQTQAVVGYDEPDEGWSEGKQRLVSHLKRERRAGLSRAKKAQYLRLHGKLECERCKLDPVAHYGTEHADACIEAHHAKTQVTDMSDGHKTRLEDLQCLCANCHRLVHKLLRVEGE